MRILSITTLFTAFIAYTNGVNISIEENNDDSLSLNNGFNSKFISSLKKVNQSVDFDELIKKGYTEDEVACLREYSNNLDCIKNMVITKSNCKKQIKECKKYYNDAVSTLPACKKVSQEEKDTLNGFVKYTASLFKLGCVDEGKCPMFQDILNLSNRKGNSNSTYVPSEDVINKDCEYPGCIDKSINLIEEHINLNEVALRTMEMENERNILDVITLTESKEEIEKENQLLKKSLEIMKSKENCKSGAFTINKTISNVLINCFAITIVFYLFMKN